VKIPKVRKLPAKTSYEFKLYIKGYLLSNYNIYQELLLFNPYFKPLYYHHNLVMDSYQATRSFDGYTLFPSFTTGSTSASLFNMDYTPI